MKNMPIDGFNRLLLPWSRIACKPSRASFLVFHASLFASAKIVVPFKSPSSSTLGNKSSSGSPPPAAAPLPPPESEVMLCRSAEVLVGTGAGVPSTLSNSLLMVFSSCGLTSSSKSFTP